MSFGSYPPFLGHYLVLIGCDAAYSEIYFLDPSSGAQLQSISKEQFEKARLQLGTDEDIIFVETTLATS